MQQFIRTTDAETALMLRKEGFMCVGESGGVFTFLNDVTKVFMEKDDEDKKIVYTNILHL